MRGLVEFTYLRYRGLLERERGEGGGRGRGREREGRREGEKIEVRVHHWCETSTSDRVRYFLFTQYELMSDLTPH